MKQAIVEVEVKEEDNNTVRELLNLLEIDAFPESITRLGNRKEQNSRPIKMKMKSLNDKELLMSSLRKLKKHIREILKDKCDGRLYFRWATDGKKQGYWS